MRYSLVGVDGNAFAIMGYTSRVLKDVGRSGLVNDMYDKAMEGDYNHLIQVCMYYIDMANELVEEREEYWALVNGDDDEERPEEYGAPYDYGDDYWL